MYMDAGGTRRLTETLKRSDLLRTVRRESFAVREKERKESTLQGYRARRESGLTVDSGMMLPLSRSIMQKFISKTDHKIIMQSVRETVSKPAEEREEECEEEKEEGVDTEGWKHFKL